MSKKAWFVHLSRRERQIMDAVYRRGQVTVADVLAEIPDPPSYSAVRAMLRILEEKGQLRHEEDGPRYVYKPVVAHKQATQSSLRQMVKTFFKGSVSDAVATLLDDSETKLSTEEVARLEKIIERAKKEGR